MSKSVKFTNDNYLDSSSIKHKRRTLNDILNNYIEVRYDGSINTPLNFDNRIRVPFNVECNGSNNNLYLRNNCVVIGKNINKVKIDYNVRIDWDTPLSAVYNFMITTSGGDQWITHRTCYKDRYIQYGVCVTSFLLNVAEGTEIALLTWCADADEAKTGNYNIGMVVQAIE